MPSRFGKILRILVATFILMTAWPSSTHALQWGIGIKNEIEIQADTFGLPLAADEISGLYHKPSVFLQKGDIVQFTVSIPEDGIYTIHFDMAAPESFINAPEGQLLVDGVFPSEEAWRIVFPIFYKNTADKFPLDRYGNEALIRQERWIRWTKASMWDANFSLEYPVQIQLSKGEHTFEFKVIKETMYLGSIYVQPPTELPDYEQYLLDHPFPNTSGVSIALEAEFPSYKNNTSVRPANNRSLGVTPYDTYRLLMNTLGGEGWNDSGSTAYYEFSVPEEGMYYITLRALQNTRDNFTVYRKITINDALLFEELNQVPFRYSTDWSNITLGSETPFRFYLIKGVNVLGIEATVSPYKTAIENIQKSLIDINALSLEIKKLTGNQVDRFKEWEITDYIPDIKDRLLAIADDLRADKENLLAINQGQTSQEIMSYQIAIDNIMFLASDPDKTPIHMNLLSEGSSSALRLLGNLLPTLQSQPLALDKIYIHSADQMPQEEQVPLYESLSEGTKRFLYSFRENPYQSTKAAQDELEVWVNRPRQYVDLLQMMTDETFTKETGIKVKFSIMPDESKLVLANAAGIQPDVALGVSTDRPYELAIRNALMDLRSFEDFDSFIQIYTPGALLSYIINDSVYAIPETQDFWVTFYRRDILDSLGLPVPKTWNGVIEILPELQRYGMNYNTPLSSGSGFKNYIFTSPYLFNHGAQLYSPDGFATGLGSNESISAMKFMAESFTLYGMPLTTSSFYDSFRYGSLPIGISSFTDYVKLMTTAPEIGGMWGLDLYPATVLPDGSQNRWATGSAQSCIMFAKTKRPEDSWKFMKWWMSTETQVDFQQQLILNYGLEYLWSSANLEAFQYLPIPDEHKAVILEQWKWLQEPVKLPGSYMQERELSDAWNRIVFDGVNPRVAIDKAVVTINREITRKMVELGFLQDGKKVKEFRIPTIDTVKGWMQNGE
jgi:ABC-type glycerol-3-phosphate transport system substrate-binding protein